MNYLQIFFAFKPDRKMCLIWDGALPYMCRVWFWEGLIEEESTEVA